MKDKILIKTNHGRYIEIYEDVLKVIHGEMSAKEFTKESFEHTFRYGVEFFYCLSTRTLTVFEPFPVELYGYEILIDDEADKFLDSEPSEEEDGEAFVFIKLADGSVYLG